jgi:hypothetical protein
MPTRHPARPSHPAYPALLPGGLRLRDEEINGLSESPRALAVGRLQGHVGPFPRPRHAQSPAPDPRLRPTRQAPFCVGAQGPRAAPRLWGSPGTAARPQRLPLSPSLPSPPASAARLPPLRRPACPHPPSCPAPVPRVCPPSNIWPRGAPVPCCPRAAQVPPPSPLSYTSWPRRGGRVACTASAARSAPSDQIASTAG